MPATTVRTTSKKGSAKSSSISASKPALATVTKRKNVSKVEGEAEATEERKAKKLKGKERAQEKEEEPVSKIKKKVDEPATKKKAVGKDKEEKKAEGTKAVSKKEKENKPTKGKANGKAKLKKAPMPPPESSDAEEDVEEKVERVAEVADENDEKEGGSGSEDGSEVLLHGFSSESDSSDEDDDNVDSTPVDVGKLPTVAKDDATVKRKLEKAKRQATDDRGVLYLGRIPHGFYEEEMKAYFSQFGDVTRLRLSRSKKTGRSKHYAFIEFSSSTVAEIVAETMDNYLLMGHILRCKLIPKKDVHPELWVGANKKFRRVPTDRIVRLQQNKTRTDEEKKNVEKRLLKRQEQKKRKLQALGIDYDFGPVSYMRKKKTKQSA